MVLALADEFWGGPKSKSYKSKVFTDPTWGQLFSCAKAAQKKTNDMHHAFFEGVYPAAAQPYEEVTILHLSLGS